MFEREVALELYFLKLFLRESVNHTLILMGELIESTQFHPVSDGKCQINSEEEENAFSLNTFVLKAPFSLRADVAT